MRSILCISLLTLLACSDKDAPTDTDTQAPEPECEFDEDCFAWEVCEATECAIGDRNDAPEDAVPLLWEQSVSAYLQTDEDVDYYSFTAQGGEYVRIRTTPVDEEEEDMNTILTLYTPIGQVHHREDEYAAGSVMTYDSILDAYLPYEGDWLITVEDVDGYGSSQSAYEIDLAEYGMHSRETDTLETPSETVDVYQAGSYWAVGVNLEEPGDIDYIQLDLPWDACPLYIYGSEYTDGTDAIPTVELFDAEGSQLLRKEDLGAGGEAIYPAVSGGKVFVAAQDALGNGGENYWFFFYVKIYEESGWEVESETNDTQAEAMELTTDWDSNEWGDVGSSGGWGVMDYEGDEDWYFIDVRQDHYISLFGNADGMGSLMDGQVEIYDSNGDLVDSGQDGIDDDDFPDIKNIGPLDAGNYSIRVSAENDGEGPAHYYRFTTYVTNYTVAE
ncbi:MAG: hypothetical protein VX519_09150 [Myxococcota bacterium]|nr:hypothetical protein [Myxococcota bacterium]